MTSTLVVKISLEKSECTTKTMAFCRREDEIDLYYSWNDHEPSAAVSTAKWKEGRKPESKFYTVLSSHTPRLYSLYASNVPLANPW